MRKPDLRAFVCLLAVMLCMAAFSIPSLAYSGEDSGNTEPQVTGSTPLAFTPDGNLSLIDDFNFTGTDADGNATSKQFITVQSKTGNYFYIVIDRADDTENVYFLNMVDEADLLALIDEPEEEPAPAVCACKDKCYAGHVDMTCSVCAVNMSKCMGKEPEPQTTEEQEPQTPVKKRGGSGIVLLFLLLLAGGGVAYYFFKIKDKPKTKGNTDLEDYEYGVEDEECAFEPYQPEEEGGEAPEDDA